LRFVKKWNVERRMKKSQKKSQKIRSESRSKSFFQRAQKYLVGGVDSPVRSFKGVGRDNPLFISKAKGSKIFDVDGNEYIDYVCSWGASIIGSAHPAVVSAVKSAAAGGLSFGAATDQESNLAERIQKSMPSIELIRFVSSGTEATMSVIRVARAFTKKNKIIKFDGCYHGHADSFLVQAGSGLATFSIADSAGVPEGVASDTLVARFNDLESVKRLLDSGQVAAVIIEPIAGNMGVIPPEEGFLEGLRELCNKTNSLLIFDEVITGFRVARGGAQALYSVQPDLTCLGKAIGGGMNIAAYGGRNDIMQLVSPLGPVYQAGTLAGNPIAVAAGIATLDELRPPSYAKMESLGARLHEGFTKSASESGVNLRVNRVGSMLGLFFLRDSTGGNVRNYDDIKERCSREGYSKFYSAMLERGIYLAPSAFETAFVSTALSTVDVSKTIRSADHTFKQSF
jgi:glutamate-1-semialdehyde 2,1-aminomutase